MKTLPYTVILERNEHGGYTITVPALKGCVTQSHTIAEGLARIKEAIECHVEALVKLRKRVPSDRKTVRLSAEELSEVLIFKITVQPDVQTEKTGVKVA